MKKARYGDHGHGPKTATLPRTGATASARGRSAAWAAEMATSGKRIQKILDEMAVEGDDAELRGLREAVNEIAESKPERVATVIRDWMS